MDEVGDEFYASARARRADARMRYGAHMPAALSAICHERDARALRVYAAALRAVDTRLLRRRC